MESFPAFPARRSPARQRGAGSCAPCGGRGSRAHGFTLLEILVALLIVSIGLLGIAGIIAIGLKNNQSAGFRSQATWLANDIVDRMRANRVTAEKPAGAKTSCYVIGLEEAPPVDGDVCATDVRQWRTALAAALPAGTGSVALDAATRKVTVVVQWDDSRGAGGLPAEDITVETRL
jgi:type IV pilus assembly protein PilV